MRTSAMKLAACLAVLLMLLLGAFAAQAEELQIELAGHHEITAYFPYYYSSTFDVCWIDNFAELDAQLDGSPVWRIETISAGNGYVSLADSNDAVMIRMGALYEEASFEYKLLCTWGDLTAEWTLKVAVQEEQNLPYEVNVPWPSLRVGDTFTFDCEVTPAVPQGAVPVIKLTQYDETAMEVVSQQGNSLTVRALRAGTFPVKLSWRIGNVELTGYSCAEIANEEGDLPGLALSFTESSARSATVYSGGAKTPFMLGTLWVNDLSLSAHAVDATPHWSWSVLNGDTSLVAVMDDSSMTDYANLYLVNPPAEAGDLTVRVYCVLEDSIASWDFNLKVQQPELGAPAGLNLPDTIEMTVGETKKFDTYDLVLPAGWQAANAAGDVSLSGVSSSAVRFEEYYIEDSWGITALQAGEFDADFTWEYENLLLSKTVKLRIADENGVVPDLTPRLTGPSEATVYTQGSFYWLDELAMISIENYSELKAVNSTEPEWKISHISGADGYVLMRGWYEDRRAITIDGNPGEGDIVVKLECTWGEKTGSHEFTLHVESLEELPASLPVQDEVTTTQGASFTLTLDNVVPAQSMTAGTTPVVTGESCYGLVTPAAEGMNLVCTADEAGTDILTVTWKYANVTLEKDIIVRIADADGIVPPMILDPYLSDYSDWLYVGAGAYQTLTDFYLEDPGVLSGAPEWTFEVLSGDPSLIGFSGYREGGYTYTARIATQPQTVQARVRCDWDGAYFEMDFTYEFEEFPGGTPTGIILPDTLDLVVGDEMEFDLTNAIRSVDVQDNLQLCRYFNFYGAHPYIDYSHTYSKPQTLTIEAQEPGVTVLYAEWEHAGFYFSHQMLVTVRDETGSTGEALKPEFYLNSVIDTVLLDGNAQDVCLARGWLDNYGVLTAFSKDVPRWSLSTVSGEAGLIEIREDDINCDLILAKAPGQTGETVVRLDCIWNGQVVSREFTLRVVDPEGTIPTTLPLAESYTMQQDDSLDIILSGARPSFWEDYEFPASIECTGIGSNYGFDSSEWRLYLSYLMPGEYHVGVTLRYANRELSGSTIVYVKDKNGIVPAGFGVDLYSGHETIYAGGNDRRVFMFDLTGYDAMYSKTGTTPDMTVTFSDDALSATTSVAKQDGEWVGAVILDETPQKTGKYTCTLNVTWGGLTVTRTMTLHVIDMPNGEPTGLNIPGRLMLTAGDKYTIKRSGLVLPAGWSTGMPDCNLEIIDHGNTGAAILRQEWNEDWDYSSDYIYRVCTPGIYSVTFRMTCSNIVLEKDVQLIIASNDTTDVAVNVPYVVAAPGLVCQLSVSGNAAVEAVRWTSLDPAVCTVDADGRVSGAAAGETNIVAEVTMTGGGKTVLVLDAECVTGSVFTLPAGLKEIGEEAFLDNAAQIVVIPEGATTLHRNAMAQMGNLRIVVMPASLTDIAPELLSGSEMAVAYCYPGTEAASFAENCGMTWMPIP